MAKQDLHFSITATNDDLKRKLAESRQAIIDSGKTAETQASRIDGSFKRMAASAAALGGGIAIGAMAKELYSFANAFDKSMREVSTISETVSADMDGFKQSVLGMTKQIPVGANDAAKALYQIISAGHDGAKGMQVLEVSAKAAIGGVTQTATAADAITTVLNAYKKDSAEAESISDQLFTTVRLGKTTFGELGQSISQAVPIAASFGIETEQVLAAVATLTKSGTPTAQAMTQIRASIIGASKALGDGYFQTHTFQEGLAEIANRAGGSEAELRKLIPEIEGMNGVLGLTGLNAQMAASDLAALGNSAGSTERAFAKMKAGTEAQVTLLKNSLLAKFHSIGEGALDVVGDIASFLNSDGIFNTTVLDDLIATMGVLIVTVGVYKAQLLITNAVKLAGNNIIIAQEIKAYQALLPVKEASKNKDIEAMVAKGQLSQKRAVELIAIRAEVQAELEKLKIKAQVLVAEAAAAAQAHKNALQRSFAAKQNMALAQSSMKIAIQSGNVEEIAAAKTATRTAKIELNSAAVGVNTTRQALGTAQSKANSAATAVGTMQTNINTVATNAGAKAKTLFAAATGRLTTAFKALGTAFKANPIGLLLIGVTLAISAFSMFGKEAENAEDAISSLERASNKSGEEFDKESAKVQALQDVMNNSKVAYDERKRALTELKTLIPQYNGELDKEGEIINNNTESIKIYLTQLEKQIKMKAVQEELEEAYRNKRKQEKDVVKKQKTFDYTKQNSNVGVVYGEGGAEAQRHALNEASKAQKDLENSQKTLNKTNDDIKELNSEIESTSVAVIGATGGSVTTFSKQLTAAGTDAKTTTKDYSSEVEDMMLKLEQSKIEILQEGRAKELAQIEITRKEKLAALEKERKGIEEKQKAHLTEAQTERYDTFKASINTGSDQEKTKVNKRYDDEIEEDWKALTAVFLSEEQKRGVAIDDRYNKERERLDERLEAGTIDKDTHAKFSIQIDASQAKEQLDALTADYQTYANQRKAIETKFDADIAALQAKNKDGKLDGNIDEAEKQKKAALSKVKIEEVSQGIDFTLLFGNLDNLTLPSAKTLRDKIKVWIDEAGNSLSPEDLKAVSDAFNKLDIKISEKGPFEVLRTSAKDLKAATIEAKDAQKALNAEVNAGRKDSEAAAKAIVDYNAALEKKATAIAKQQQALSSAVDKGKQIMGAAQDVISILDDLGVKVPENISNAIGGLGQVMDGLGSIDLAKPLSIVTGAIKMLGGLVKTVSSLFNGDAVKEEEIQRLQEQIDGLETSYDKLGKSIEKAYSTDASQMIEQQNIMLEKQKELIKLQIAQEETKKDSDGGKIDDWKKQLDELDEKIVDNKEKSIDAIFGADVKSAIDDFANAYVDAWSAGEDRAQAQKDVVKKMIQGIVTEIIKSNIADKVAALRTALKDAIIDGIINDTEQAAIDKLQDEIYAQSEKDAKAYEKWLKEDDAAQNEASLVGQIKGSVATEASVAELGGIFRGQYDKLASIEKSIGAGFTHLLDIARTNAQIEANTRATAVNTAATVEALAIGFSAMQGELVAINQNTSKDNGSYGG